MLPVQTQAATWKAATPQQLTGAHLYLDIAKSGYLFQGFSGGMCIIMSHMLYVIISKIYILTKIVIADALGPNDVKAFATAM